MESNSLSPRLRKSPEQRRAEILEAATDIAISEGLEKITLRSVAAVVGVRPGLINHYFPAVEDLVTAAFAAGLERLRTYRLAPSGDPVRRLQAFIDGQTGRKSQDLTALWLNARHLSRHSAAVSMVIEEVEEADRRELVTTISEGISVGVFPTCDPVAAAIRILMSLDGYGAYANDAFPFDHDAYAHFAFDVSEWALSLAPGSLRVDDEADSLLE